MRPVAARLQATHSFGRIRSKCLCPVLRLIPNCSHRSVIVNRPLFARTTNRLTSSMGVTFCQGIVPETVTHHSGLSVTYHSGSNRLTSTARRMNDGLGRQPSPYFFTAGFSLNSTRSSSIAFFPVFCGR